MNDWNQFPDGEPERTAESPMIFPIMVPRDSSLIPYIPDTVPPCASTYPFTISYKAHDTVILDWTHNGDGDFQATMDHSGADFLSGTLIDFSDSLDRLVLTGLEQGDHTLCFRRHCQHECDYHGLMDYYSNWGNCLFFYVEGAEAGIAQADGAGVRLQPNPAHSEVRIEAEVPIMSVELCDLAGRTLLHKSAANAESALTLSLEGLPKGTYMVRVGTAHGTAVRKLVVL